VRRADRLPSRQQEILALAEAGYTVRKLTDYQFRVNNALDLYPTHKRFHVLMTGRRGSYQTAASVAQKFLRAPKEKSGRLKSRDGRATPEREGHVRSP
jgi:vancomycin permeability regulator SanA